MSSTPEPGWKWSLERVLKTVHHVRAGRSLQPASWPNGARVAVLLSFDVDNETTALRYGQRIEIEARVRRPRNFGNPGSFDYSGYLARQEADIIALRRDESLSLPATVDYAAIPSLSAELRQKLQRIKPASLGQAARIDGMTPAALTAILGHVRRSQTRASA